MSTTVHLRGASSDVVLDWSSGVPAIVHWGAPLGDVDADAVVASQRRPFTNGMLDVVAPISVVPEHGSGFPGRPGLAGNRPAGRAWSPRFAVDSVTTVNGGVVVRSVDAVAELALTTTITLDDVLQVHCEVTNLGASRYLLDALHPTIALPAHAGELLSFTGRWTRELHPVRTTWREGAHVWEDRSGRTSHEHPPFLVAGTPGFGEWTGEVWGVQLAWSGNHTVLAEVLPDSRRLVQLGELLHPGELVLEAGKSYRSPTVIGSYSSTGLTPMSWGHHRFMRSLPASPRTARPVLLNTWEAVYFRHETARLQELATSAAELGIERFVLDDGWFGPRRDDRRGLGDWWVSPEVYPDGLGPLIDHVRGLGMEFGIWVEPEMVNPDSDLFRDHPDWALTTDGYDPVLGRNQLVLDLGRPDAFGHVLGLLDRLLADHDITFVKWDMNRQHTQGSGADGAAGSHAQTLALYSLLDELRRRHPSVEIESCASGGGRIDAEILRRTERVWTSDCNDALERQTIQRGASMFIPPEVMGAHIGPERSHTTGRRHTMAFRALTAMFGHLGVEADVTAMSDDDRAALAAAIAVHQRFRPLLHGGDVVRFDTAPVGPESGDVVPATFAHGVYAADRDEALVAFVQLRTAMSLIPPPLRLPGLDPDRTYRFEPVDLGSGPKWDLGDLRLTGRQLAVHGIQPPRLWPESGVLLRIVRS